MSLAISAIVAAIHMITVHCKNLKFKKQIVLVTNGLGSMDIEDMAEIVKKLKTENISLLVL